MMTEAENPYQSPLVAGAAFERVGPSGWRFFPMTLAIVLGLFYLLFWGLGIIGTVMNPNSRGNGFAWPTVALSIFFGLPGIGMLFGALLWFRVRYIWATVLCGLCMLPLLFIVAFFLLALLA